MSSISVSAMREYVAGMYPHEGWKYRVRNLMHQNQIIAIFCEAQKRGQIDVTRSVKDSKTPAKESTRYRQLNLFKDFGLEAYPNGKEIQEEKEDSV